MYITEPHCCTPGTNTTLWIINFWVKRERKRRVSWDPFLFQEIKHHWWCCGAVCSPVQSHSPRSFPRRKLPSRGWHISSLNVFLRSYCICHPMCEWYGVGLCVFIIHIPGFYNVCILRLPWNFFLNSVLGHRSNYQF